MREEKSAESVSLQEFEGAVREHQAGLRAFVRALGVDEAWVDDVAQQVFIIAYRRLRDFEAGTDFGKWLRSIARNLAANERRKDARRSRLLPFAVADVLLHHDGEDELFRGDLDQMLQSMQECVEQLPLRSRELLRRRYAEGENASSLANELGMNADTVRQTLLRIRVLVKACIDKKGGRSLGMKAARYRELLGGLLEDNLSPSEAEELGFALKSSPPLRRDLRQHLALWEMWSQDQSPERSATRFIHSWETRLRADSEGPNEFAAAVQEKLEDYDRGSFADQARKEARPQEATGRRMALWFQGLRIFSGRRARLFWPISAAIVLMGYAWVATTRSSSAAMTIRGEGICTVCTLNQGQEHLQAIQVIRAGNDRRLYYLEKNQISAGVYFCDGPIPVVGKGYLKTNETRLSLAATELKVQRR